MPFHYDPEDDDKVQAFEMEAYEGLDDNDNDEDGTLQELKEFENRAALGDEDEDELDEIDVKLGSENLSPIKKVSDIFYKNDTILHYTGILTTSPDTSFEPLLRRLLHRPSAGLNFEI